MEYYGHANNWVGPNVWPSTKLDYLLLVYKVLNLMTQLVINVDVISSSLVKLII